MGRWYRRDRASGVHRSGWVRALTGLALFGCAGHPEQPYPEDIARWHTFYWATVADDSVEFRRAAILVADSLVDRAVSATLLQLDLAGSGTLPFGFPSPDPNARVVPARNRLHGLLHGFQAVRVSPAPSVAGRDSTPLRQIGSFGLPAFEYSILLLDFSRQRLGVVPPLKPIPAAMWVPARTVPVAFDGSRVLVPISTPGGQYQALLDTGLSPFPLWTTRKAWQELTGRRGDEADNRRYRLPHPLGPLTFVEARSRQPLRIGATGLGTLPVVFLERGPAGARLEGWPFRLDAVLGASAFGPNRLLALDLRHRRLVVLPTSGR